MGTNDKRFETIYSQGTLDHTKIMVDRETGVNYVFHKVANSAGMTILVDRDGKPVVTEISK